MLCRLAEISDVIADGNSDASADELWKVRIQTVVWEASDSDIVLFYDVCEAKDFSCPDSIFSRHSRTAPSLLPLATVPRMRSKSQPGEVFLLSFYVFSAKVRSRNEEKKDRKITK